MLKYLLAEGEISCAWKGEKKSASFRNGLKIPDLNFSQGDIIKFEVKFEETGGLNAITRITGTRREGTLYFQVFPSGRKIKPNSGLVTFSPNSNQEEQDFRWAKLLVIEGYKGAVGTMDVELHIKRLIG